MRKSGMPCLMSATSAAHPELVTCLGVSRAIAENRRADVSMSSQPDEVTVPSSWKVMVCFSWLSAHRMRVCRGFLLMATPR